MASLKSYISAGVSPTKKSDETPTELTAYVSAGVTPVYHDAGGSSVPVVAQYYRQMRTV